jgi:hypothetical protein
MEKVKMENPSRLPFLPSPFYLLNSRVSRGAGDWVNCASGSKQPQGKRKKEKEKQAAKDRR